MYTPQKNSKVVHLCVKSAALQHSEVAYAEH